MEQFKNAALRILILVSVPLTLLVLPEIIHSPSEPGWIGETVKLVRRPLVTIDHALCIIIAALLVGQQKPPHLGAAIAALFAGLVSGYLAIQVIPGFPLEGVVPLVLALLYGLTVAAAPAIGAGLVMALVGLAGIGVGFNTYPEDSTVLVLATTLAGLLAGAALIFSPVAWLASKAERDWQRIGVRIAGSWIAAIAALILALVLKSMGVLG